MTDQTPPVQSQSKQREREKFYDEHIDGWERVLRDTAKERDEARAALLDVRKERSHGATANSEYIDRRIVEGLGEGRA